MINLTTKRSAFTMIELLLVLAVIAILAAIVIIAVNPTQQLTTSRDAQRNITRNQILKAIDQYLIDTGSNPGDQTIPEGSDNAIDICDYGTTDASCTNILSDLIPVYLPEFERDVGEANSLHSGYSVYTQNSRPQVLADNVSSSVVYSGGSSPTTACVSGATYPISVGNNPRSIMAYVGNQLYVANNGNDTVSVVNTTTDTVTDTISVGSSPISTVSDGGTGVYVLGDGDINVIDTTSNTVVDTISRTFTRFGVVTNNKLFATVSGGGVDVIDATNNTFVTAVFSIADSIPMLVGTELFLTGQSSSSVEVLDTTTNGITNTINTFATGLLPGAQVGTGLYLPDPSAFATDVYVIDTSTESHVDTVTVGTQPWDTTLNGTGVFVANNGSDNVSVIDTATNTVVATIALTDTGPFGITAFDGDLYVSSNSNISQIDGATLTLSGANFAPSPGVGFAISDRLYIPNNSADHLDVFIEGGADCYGS